MFLNKLTVQFQCDAFPEHTYSFSEDKYYIILLPQDLLAIGNDIRYPWKDGEEGHLQTIVEYIESEQIVVAGKCRTCDAKQCAVVTGFFSLVKSDGFVGRNKKGLVSIYAKYGDD